MGTGCRPSPNASYLRSMPGKSKGIGKQQPLLHRPNKGGRKLAPKPKPNTFAMQSEGGFGQLDFSALTHEQVLASYTVAATNDMFVYPLSARASAPAYLNQRPFWDSGPGLGDMDVDFASGAHLLPDPTPTQQLMGLLDWGRADEGIEGGGVVARPEQAGHADKVDALDGIMSTQASMALNTSAVDHSSYAASYSTPADDPFSILGHEGVVAPGLLFSRPPSSPPVVTEPHHPSVAAPLPTEQAFLFSKAPMGGEAQRSSAAVVDMSPTKPDSANGRRSVKASARPRVCRRSSSENRGKQLGCSALPALAPAPRSHLPRSSGAEHDSRRPVTSQNNRSGGSGGSRSPRKPHEQGLAGLSSIPEVAGSCSKGSWMTPTTRAKLTIDANGRAHVETTVTVEGDDRSRVKMTYSHVSVGSQARWDSSDDDHSSTDDEPIIIPSRRKASFALPDPCKPTTVHPFSLLDRASFLQETMDDDSDSEAEMVPSELTPTCKSSSSSSSGNAVGELRRLRDSRHQQMSASKPMRTGSGTGTGTGTGPSSRFGGRYRGYDTSPTKLTETSLSTPSTGSRTKTVRCVCDRPEVDMGSDFLVQCGSCGMFVHGPCVKLTQHSQPSIYICAFCARTPSAQKKSGRVVKTKTRGRPSASARPVSASVVSPLAHKSAKTLQSFR